MESTLIEKILGDVAKELSADDIELLRAVLKQNPGGELEILQELASYAYRERQVGIRRFVEDPHYLGLFGQVYPRLLDDLEEMFDGTYIEVVLLGGIGWGKSTVASIAATYMLYQISTIQNPQRVYGLMDGTPIVLLNASINANQAKRVVFQDIRSKVHNSPYFREKFPHDDSSTRELRFPGNVWVFPATSSESGIIGYNVFGGILDELNFMAVIERSKMRQGEKYDQATTLYNALIRRMKSRFMNKGKLPGLLVMISSSQYPDDFTERKMLEAKDDPTIFARRYAQWETKPKEMYSGEKFYVSLGDLSTRPRIIENENQAKAEEDFHKRRVIEVPVEYYQDFQKDIDAAIRDIAGQPTLAIHPFITQRHKVFDAYERGKKLGLFHPFSYEQTTLRDGMELLEDRLQIPKLKRALSQLPEGPERQETLATYMKLAAVPRFIHVDLAIRRDAAGFGMAYISGWTEVKRRDEEGNIQAITAPIVVVEAALRIVAPPNGEIIIGDIRQLIFRLRDLGYPIQLVTFDQYQSVDSQQQLRQAGIDADYVSVDAPGAYDVFKDALYEDRLTMYEYDPLTIELLRLEKDEKTHKVDHPPNGSKDVADAVVGSVYNCHMNPVLRAPAPVLGELYSGDSAGGRDPVLGLVIPGELEAYDSSYGEWSHGL